MSEFTAVWGEHSNQAWVCVGYILAISILAWILSRRSLGFNPLRVRAWQGLSWARGLCLAVYVLSWVFLAMSCMILLGVGTSTSDQTCATGIILCVTAYCGSKLLIYLFLIERVYIISEPQLRPRHLSTTYRLCAAVVAPYLIVIGLMAYARISVLESAEEGGRCIIGVQLIGAIPVLTYDAFLNVFLTTMFVIPIAKSQFVNDKMKKLAIRTSIAAAAALATSVVNIGILMGMKGHQLSWVCLGCCGLDVTANALVLYFITWSPEDRAMDDAPVRHTAFMSQTAMSTSGYHGSPMDPNDVYEWTQTNTFAKPRPGESAIGRGDLEMGQVTNVYLGGGRATVTKVLDSPRGEKDIPRKRGREGQRAKEKGWFGAIKEMVGLRGNGQKENNVGLASIQVQVETVREVERIPPSRPDSVIDGTFSPKNKVRFQERNKSESLSVNVLPASEPSVAASVATDVEEEEWERKHPFGRKRDTSDDDLINALERSARLEMN